jgi:hypothetical protein
MATALATRGRKTRKAGAPTPAPAKYINIGTDDNSLTRMQVQRVINMTGLSPVIAAVVAPLLFGGAA